MFSVTVGLLMCTVCFFNCKNQNGIFFHTQPAYHYLGVIFQLQIVEYFSYNFTEIKRMVTKKHHCVDTSFNYKLITLLVPLLHEEHKYVKISTDESLITQTCHLKYTNGDGRQSDHKLTKVYIWKQRLKILSIIERMRLIKSWSIYFGWWFNHLWTLCCTR